MIDSTAHVTNDNDARLEMRHIVKSIIMNVIYMISSDQIFLNYSYRLFLHGDARPMDSHSAQHCYSYICID